jgi:hypothetical protein
VAGETELPPEDDEEEELEDDELEAGVVVAGFGFRLGFAL